MKNLEIDVFGGLSIRRQSKAIKLPTSRKTRAMLAFLLLTGKPQHRERLCDIFWEGPDDPKAALRTAIWKLRRLINEPGAERILADREWVSFDPVGVETDFINLDRQARSEEELSGQEFAEARAVLDQPLLAGLDLPDCKLFQAWLVSMRERAEELRERLLPDDLGSRVGSPLDRSGQLHLARQQIGFARASDGARIAWARIGSGPPLVKAANWLNHLELDWDSDVWSPLFQELARDHTFLRYDGRGNGMSDWQVADLRFESMVKDLKTVVEQSGVERFPLLGISQGAAVAIAYAAQYPDRVSHLILCGGYASGWRVDDPNQTTKAEKEALITLVASGWERDDGSYRDLFSQALIPSATSEERIAFNEFQRRTVSAANAARFLETFADIDVRDHLPAIACPTLVIHARDDRRVPVEKGAELASMIDGSEFVTLPTDNHLLLGREHSSELFVAHVRQFLEDQEEGGV